MAAIDNNTRTILQNELETKKICRFCLTQKLDKLENIYSRDLKTTTPLPLQIMSCASIEVFSNDGMPSWVCSDCRRLFEHSYQFKQMCKQAETLLRQFPLIGEWPEPLDKPKFLEEISVKSETKVLKQQSIVKTAAAAAAATETSYTYSKQRKTFPQHTKSFDENTVTIDSTAPIKILNSNPSTSPEPPVPLRLKTESLDHNDAIIILDNDELSMDDVQRLIAATDNEEEFISSKVVTNTIKPKGKPKVLNKSSMRILNKEANIEVEPRISRPQLKRDEDGNVAIVTEILDPDSPYEPEPDPIKTATPVETNIFPCPHCERSFPLRQLRDIHMVNHNRERRFQCSGCDKSFFSKYDLQKHSFVHTGDKPFKCTVCSKAFTRSTLLHRHEKTHTDIPKFICVFCEKQFISEEEMEKHTERHRRNRPFQCKICNKAFAFKQGLERHEVVHSRDQPYPCQYCDLSFSTPSKLARHLTAHAGKRPYPCKFCAKSYLLSHHLTRHMRSHKQEGDNALFICNDCNKTFKSRDELIYHSITHATQTLICPFCKENFGDSGSVTTHVRLHAEGDVYACEFCDQIFLTSERLDEHTEADHIEDMVAYREDDKTQSEERNREKSDQMDVDCDMAKIDDTLHETIDEFFIDDLPEGVQILTDEMVDYSASDSQTFVTIKEENDLDISNHPVIITTRAYATDELVQNEDLILGSCDSLIAENIDLEGNKVDLEDNMHGVPAKLRKTVSTTNQNSQILAKANESVLIQKISPQLHRKLPKKTLPIAPAVAAKSDINAKKLSHIQIEKNELIVSPYSCDAENVKQLSSINTVLNSIPKSVSVRRNIPTSTVHTSLSTSDKKLLTVRPIPESGTTSSKASSSLLVSVVKAVTTVPKNTTNTQGVSKLSGKVYPTTTKLVPAMKVKSPVPQKQVVSKASPDIDKLPKNINIEQNNLPTNDQKKQKLQHISVTKAQAAALKKEGRIKYKDGNMILTQNIAK